MCSDARQGRCGGGWRGLAATAAVCASAIVLSTASAAAREPAMVVIIAGNISVRDVADAPALAALARSGSAALLNVRSGRPTKDVEAVEPAARTGLEAGCVSLGSGSMAIGGAEVRRASNAAALIDRMRAADLYQWRTGRPPGTAQVVHPEAVKMAKINASGPYRARPGLLGSVLRSAGITTAVVGNSDLPGEPHREAVAAAMDEYGLVDYGDVDSPSLLAADPTAPYGVRAEPDALLRALDGLLGRARFIVIDFGDTFRADLYAQQCTDGQAALLRRQACERLGVFAQQVAGRLDSRRDLLALVSPSSRTFTELEDERLTAAILKGRQFGPGMLYSPSTRRSGVITVSDLAPTFLEFLGIPAQRMQGRPVRAVSWPDPLPSLLKANAGASSQARLLAAMRGTSVAQSVLVVLATALILLGSSTSWRVAAGWAAVVPAALPLAMLYLPLLGASGLEVSVALLAGLTAALLVASRVILGSPERAFAWLCAALVASLAADLLRGGPLIGSSMAGYSLAEGARYYGIGNELMGAMMGAAVVGLGMWLASGGVGGAYRELAVAAVLGLVLVIIGLYGANLGGAMSVAPAAAAFVLARRGWRPSVRGVALLAALTVLTAGALIAADAMRGGAAQSHAGRFAAGATLSSMVQVFERKMMLNVMLVSSSPWSRLLGLSLTGSALLLWLGRGRPLGPELRVAAAACGVGIAAAFALNDSGVLAAAACSVFLWSMLAVHWAERTAGSEQDTVDRPQ